MQIWHKCSTKKEKNTIYLKYLRKYVRYRNNNVAIVIHVQ